MSFGYEYGEDKLGYVVRLAVLEEGGWRVEMDESRMHMKLVPTVELDDAQKDVAFRAIERLVMDGSVKVPYLGERSLRDVLKVVQWAVKYDTP